MIPIDGHLIQEDEHSCQSKKKAAIRDRPCRSEDRSSQEGGDDGHPLATSIPLTERRRSIGFVDKSFSRGKG